MCALWLRATIDVDGDGTGRFGDAGPWKPSPTLFPAVTAADILNTPPSSLNKKSVVTKQEERGTFAPRSFLFSADAARDEDLAVGQQRRCVLVASGGHRSSSRPRGRGGIVQIRTGEAVAIVIAGFAAVTGNGMTGREVLIGNGALLSGQPIDAGTVVGRGQQDAPVGADSRVEAKG